MISFIPTSRSSISSPSVWIVGLVYYLVWFICIYCATLGWVWSCWSLMTLFGLWLLSYQPLWSFRCALMIMAYGMCFDSLYVFFDLYHFPHHAQMITPSPLWLASFWFSFSALLTSSLRWIFTHRWIALSLGALGGPLSYLGGERMGGMLFPTPITMSVILLGGGWMFSMLLIEWTIYRLESQSSSKQHLP